MHECADRRNFACMAKVHLSAFKAVRIFIRDKGRSDVPALKAVMIIDRLQEGNIMANAVELESIERGLHGIYGNAAILAPCAEPVSYTHLTLPTIYSV